jgi:hypothetical protein
MSDVLTRAKLALGIEEEPEFAPPVAAKPAAPQPAAPFPDKAQVAELLERARLVLSPSPAPPAPQTLLRRVEIMVTYSASRMSLVRHALSDLQHELLQQAGAGNLELRVTAFFDGCRHTTPWSLSAIDLGRRTTAWHCFQGRTRYSEALAYTANEAEPVDAIVMFGDRFDDNLAHALGIAERLKKQGTRIYAFHVGGKWRSRDAYAQLAESTGGAFVPLSEPRAFRRVLSVIADYVLRPAEALRALPPPADPDTKALVDQLKLLPPPAPRLLPGRKS